MSFSFGNTAKTTASSGFSFGATSTPAAGNAGFSFGNTVTTSATAGGSGFSFGGAKQPSSTATNLFGTSTAAKLTTGAGLFGSSTPVATGSLFGSAAPANQTVGSSFSFGQSSAADVSKPAAAFGGFQTNTPAVSTSTPSGFSFGATPSSAKPAFGSTATTAPPAFGASLATTTPSTGFSLTSATPASSAAKPFSFGATTQQTSTPFSLGGGTTNTPTTKPPAFGATTSGFSFSATPTTTVSSGFSLGGGTLATAASSAATGFSLSTGGSSGTKLGFGAPSSTGTPTTKPPSFGAVPATTVSSAGSFGAGFKLGGLSTTSASVPAAAPGGFSFPSSTPAANLQPSSTGFSLSSTISTTPAVSSASTDGFKLGRATTDAKTLSGFGGGLSMPAPSGATFSLNKPALTTSATATTTSGLTTLLSNTTSTSTAAATTTNALSTKSLFPSTSSATTKPLTLNLGTASNLVTSSGAGTSTAATPALTYKDLEAKINKWTPELEQQERLFLNQATQVNAWNKLLIDNSEEITNLNLSYEGAKADQQRLNQELDYIKTQEKELEEILVPLEIATKQQVNSIAASVHTHHADIERERTYSLAENIDGQLKIMVQDLRGVIEDINATSTPVDNNNPINQISKILSAHMDSLQWLDTNSSSLQQKLDQLTKQVSDRKMEEESRFRLAFD